MKSLKIYEYKNCGTCRKALKHLEERGVAFERIPIRETPPTKTELKAMLKSYEGERKRLFNTSGGDYKSMNMKDRLPDLTDEEAIALLSENGNLIKRPFVLSGDQGVIGFKVDEWDAFLERLI
ncbi:MAG: arsenate reductase family protein [Verrucomicrobia bacterium]|nr:arsenate reductase family protein [Verrucomicrobiota bacterium]MBT6806045.1 arsenate reductase family protein [Verrucomicrobiota bacterium]